jgi:hypothetical protein
MSNAIHPTQEALLRLADEDLALDEARGVERHLAGCAGCRDEFLSLRETSEEILRFHQNVLKPSLPSPPRAWEPPRWKGTAPRVIPFPIRVAAGAAAAIAAVVLVRWMLRPVPVSAAELLRKAEVREQAASSARHRIRIRYKNYSWTRPARLTGSAYPAPGDPAGIEAVLRQAGFPSEDPLSASAFSQWRNRLPERHDEVRRDPETYVVTTSAPTGVIREASLTLRSSDLLATRATLRYRSNETLDMDEVPADDGDLQGAQPRIPELAAPPVEPRPASPATPAEEVEVTAALHSLGADLGEPIDVARTGGVIVISGAGLPASRQEQIRAAVSGIAGVRVVFEPGDGRRVGGGGLPGRTAAPPDVTNPLLDLLRAAANSAADPGDALIDATDRAVQRAYALATLARRFPPPSETVLAASDRSVLRSIAMDHARVLSTSVGSMTGLLLRVLSPVNGAPAATSSWQETADAMVAASRDADQAINAATGDLDARESRLAGALARLRGLIETMQTQLR